MRSSRRVLGAVLASVVAAWATAAHAVDVEKKLRIGLEVGGYDTQNEIASDSANALTWLENNEPVAVFLDPREDATSFGSLKIEPTPRAVLTLQYAVTKMFVLEAAVGYQKGDVGDVEIQAQFNGVDIPQTRDFLFSVYRIPAGKMEQVPLQLTAMARFRPRANFNPFIGAGVGYTFVGFEPSADLDLLSQRMDASTGGFAPLTVSGARFSPPTTIRDLSGATVRAPDTFEWHVTGGAEYSFSRKWAAFLDVRYQFASRDFRLQFDGRDGLGVGVPDVALEFNDPRADISRYGAIQIASGGLVDGGRLAPDNPQNIPEDQYAAYCAANPGECSFEFVPDGQVDAGYYYVQGGSLRYGGFVFSVGVRYTF